jgi:hypothetical protein
MPDKNHSSLSPLSTVAYTVVTPNYLAHAWSLQKSFLQHNPDSAFFICLVGNESHYPEMTTENVYFINSLNDSRIEGMIQRYDPFELTCNLKPFFAAHIFEQNIHLQRLIYLDSDMYVFGQFGSVTEAAITLSPHRTKNTGQIPGMEIDNSLNKYGVYNAGYFELRRKNEAFAFLDWWKMLMEKSAFNKVDEHSFSDQLWLNAVPSFFDDLYINKNPGYNAAIWNLIERKIEEKNEIYFINDQPLIMYHFSKYKIEEPGKLVFYDEPYLTFNNFPELKTIYQKYRQGLLDAGYEKIKTIPYPIHRSVKRKHG